MMEVLEAKTPNQSYSQKVQEAFSIYFVIRPWRASR